MPANSRWDLIRRLRVNMFPISWLTCLPRSDRHSQSQMYCHTQCTGVRFYEFHFHSDYLYLVSGSIICSLNFRSNWVTMRKAWTFRGSQPYTLFYYFIVNEVLFRTASQQNNCYKDCINFYVFLNILLNMCASSRYVNLTCTLSINTEQGYVMRHIFFYINLSCRPVTVVTFRQISSRNGFCHPHHLQYYTKKNPPLVL